MALALSYKERYKYQENAVVPHTEQHLNGKEEVVEWLEIQDSTLIHVKKYFLIALDKAFQQLEVLDEMNVANQK